MTEKAKGPRYGVMATPQTLVTYGDDVTPKAAAPSSKKDRRPTPDQMYLAEKMNYDASAWDETPPPKPNRITPAALQKWNLVYGVAAVSDAMRTAWGFPPLGGIENPYAYVQQILRGNR